MIILYLNSSNRIYPMLYLTIVRGVPHTYIHIISSKTYKHTNIIPNQSQKPHYIPYDFSYLISIDFLHIQSHWIIENVAKIEFNLKNLHSTSFFFPFSMFYFHHHLHSTSSTLLMKIKTVAELTKLLSTHS